MSFNGLRLEYSLDGSSNYIAWKDRMEVVLEDNGLKEFIEHNVPRLGSMNQSMIEILGKYFTCITSNNKEACAMFQN